MMNSAECCEFDKEKPANRIKGYHTQETLFTVKKTTEMRVFSLKKWEIRIRFITHLGLRFRFAENYSEPDWFVPTTGLQYKKG